MTECGAERDVSQGEQHAFLPGRLGKWCISDYLLEVREMTYLPLQVASEVPTGDPGNNMPQFEKSCKWR